MIYDPANTERLHRAIQDAAPAPAFTMRKCTGSVACAVRSVSS
jgi:hypothetical protein